MSARRHPDTVISTRERLAGPGDPGDATFGSFDRSRQKDGLEFVLEPPESPTISMLNRRALVASSLTVTTGIDVEKKRAMASTRPSFKLRKSYIGP